MRQIAINTFIFGCLTLIIVFVIGNIQLPDSYVCYKTQNTSYHKIAWNLHLIDSHPERINGGTIFLGPSLIQGGICDSTLCAGNVEALNMGTNGGGNEMEYYFLERIAGHHPKKIFLHLFKDRRRGLHPMTPLLFTPIMLLKSGQSVNFPFFKFLFKRAGYVIDCFVWKFSGREFNNFYSRFGKVYDQDHYTSENYKSIDRAACEDYFYSFNIEKNNFRKLTELNRKGFLFSLIRYRRALIHFFRNSEMFYNTDSQMKFDKASFDLCDKCGISCEYLYMPVVADAKIGIDFSEQFYTDNQSRPVLALKNFKWLDAPEYWADQTHLSRKGNLIYTSKLLSEKLIVSE